MKLDWLTPQRLEQLSLNLDVEEPASASDFVSPDEARLRSELARNVLAEKQKATQEDGANNPVSDWTEDYLHLRESGWPWRVAAYIAWASSPKRGRWPENVEALAGEVLGLSSPRVIYTWRKKNPGIDELVALMQAAPLLEHRADVIGALVASASDPDHRSNPDRKLYLELTGDYVPRAKVDLTDESRTADLSQLSDEELDKLSGKLLDRSSDSESEGIEE